MRKVLLFISFLQFFVISSYAQKGYYTRYYADKALCEEAKTWVEQGEWRNGFTKASPFKDVNVVDFYQQYQRNRSQWDAAFNWLATHDLLAVEKGKHPIEGTELVVSVEDSENGPLEKRQSESHYHKIDLQYCVKGIERFGVIDHYTSTPNCKYRPDVIHYDYDVTKTHFYDSTPNEFYLFFPGDWHIAKINNDTDDQVIRVIVIKLDYVE